MKKKAHQKNTGSAKAKTECPASQKPWASETQKRRKWEATIEKAKRESKLDDAERYLAGGMAIVENFVKSNINGFNVVKGGTISRPAHIITAHILPPSFIP